MKRIVLASLCVVLISGCSLFEKDDAPPLPGARMAALPVDLTALDSQTLGTFALPDPWVNEAWPQAGGFPGHAMQNVALPTGSLNQQWAVDIGQGTMRDAPLTSAPVIEGGRVFALDSAGDLSVLDATTGRLHWRHYIGSRDEDDYASGGGVAVDGDTVYVTNGYAEAVALSTEDGKEYWRTRLSAPARAAPSVLDGRVMVMTIDGQIHALEAITGKVLWSYRGLAEGTGVLGAAAPAMNRDLVIVPFSSGEIVALRVENGAVAWSDQLAQMMRFGGIGSLSDIRALPVLDGGLVFAMSYGGRLVAIDERTGARVWQRDIGGTDTPWVVGDNLFVLSKDAQLLALDRQTGAMRWRLDLPRYHDPVSKDEPILWSGPIVAGGRIMVWQADGVVYNINPSTGQVMGDWKLDQSPVVPMAIADETLYVLGRDGTVAAWK